METLLLHRIRNIFGLSLLITTVGLFNDPAKNELFGATRTCRTFTKVSSEGRLVASQRCTVTEAVYRTSAQRPSRPTVGNSTRTDRGAARSSNARTSVTRRTSARTQSARTVTTRPAVPLGRGDYRYVNGRLLYFPNQRSTNPYNVVGPLPATVAPTTPTNNRRTPIIRVPAPGTPDVVATPVAPIDPFQLATETLEQHPLPPPEPHIPPFQAIAGVPLELTINGATEPTFQLLASANGISTGDPITYACNASSFAIDWGDGETLFTERRALHTHIWQNRGQADLSITANWTCQYRIESTQQTGTLTTSTQTTQPIPVREVQPVLVDNA